MQSKTFVIMASFVNFLALVLTTHGIVFRYVTEANFYPAFLIRNFGIWAVWVSFFIFWTIIYRFHGKIGIYISKKMKHEEKEEFYNIVFSATIFFAMIPDLVNNIIVFWMYLTFLS